ncbi:MAG: glycerophosphodiester phosphodiesterase [Pseudomonadota bacterium]
MIVIGHRGARGEAPENTLPSFRHAIAAGVRHFELDVRLSWDERPVVIHDATVERTTGEAGAVADLPAAQLAALDARRNTPGWAQPAGIPTLEEVLVAGSVVESWQLEVKSDAPARIRVLVRRMAELVSQLKLGERATLTSLDPEVLKIAQKEAPSLNRAYVAEQADPEPVKTARKYGCIMLVSNWRLVDEPLLARARQAELPVSVWTVNDLVVAERLANLGVDSLITDFPTALLAHFRMRDRLHPPPD